MSNAATSQVQICVNDVLETMESQGGSFVKALAVALRHADATNFVRLMTAFQDYWEQYATIARRAKSMQLELEASK